MNKNKIKSDTSNQNKTWESVLDGKEFIVENGEVKIVSIDRIIVSQKRGLRDWIKTILCWCFGWWFIIPVYVIAYVIIRIPVILQFIFPRKKIK